MRAQLLLAAMQGDPHAEFEAGEAWRRAGNVVELALHWYRKAASRGHAGAALRLAVILADHGRLHHDPEEAFYWCLRAALGGSEDAKLLYPRMRRDLPARALHRVMQRVCRESWRIGDAGACSSRA